MAKYTREEVEKILSNGIHTVVFTKASDATLCTMNCTRDFEWVRAFARHVGFKGTKGGKATSDAIKVWCIDEKEEWENGFSDVYEWRSFHPETIESIKFFSPTRVEDDFYENGEGVEI